MSRSRHHHARTKHSHVLHNLFESIEGLFVEASHRRQTSWAVLPMSDGHTLVGLAFHLRWANPAMTSVTPVHH